MSEFLNLSIHQMSCFELKGVQTCCAAQKTIKTLSTFWQGGDYIQSLMSLRSSLCKRKNHLDEKWLSLL